MICWHSSCIKFSYQPFYHVYENERKRRMKVKNISLNNPYRLSTNLRHIETSGIYRFLNSITSRDNVISLGIGEPDVPTPTVIREAAMNSIAKGETGYTDSAGLVTLREEISAYLDKRFSMKYEPMEEVLVTVGASEAIDLALRALLNPGDEVLVVEPCYVSYAPIITLSGAIPIPVETDSENNFTLLASQLENKVTNRTKALILNYPNNPTGTIMNKSQLEEVAKIVKRYNLVVISDEIYAELTFDDRHCSIATLPDMKERTIVISGFSKAFAMTGWRIGYAVGPADIIAGMLKIHQYCLMCASSMAQYGALAALQSGIDDMLAIVEHYHLRRDYFVNALNDIGLPCHSPGGTFYAFPSIKKFGMDSESFARKLFEEEQVIVIPGNALGLGGEGHIRCSFATSMEQMEEAIIRIHRFIKKCK